MAFRNVILEKSQISHSISHCGESAYRLTSRWKEVMEMAVHNVRRVAARRHHVHRDGGCKQKGSNR